MSSNKHGVSKLVSDLESRAVYMHCYGHAQWRSQTSVDGGAMLTR